jgi:hypothetical protein
MVAGQSCIASPAVYFTLCHARLLDGALLCFHGMRNNQSPCNFCLRAGSV